MSKKTGEEERLYMGAKEAASELGISPATLYAYVSRGQIRSEATGGARKERRYYTEDIERLKARKELRRNPAKAAQTALDWGMPVLESAITLIANGTFYYRGENVVELAKHTSLEDVAVLLWGSSLSARELFGAQTARPTEKDVKKQKGLPPVQAFQRYLPFAGHNDIAGYDVRPEAVVRTGARILLAFTAFAAGHSSSNANIANTLRMAWAAGDQKAERLISGALTLCADHELNVSAFTARCIASAGSTPYQAVLGGLAALQGTKHGGYTESVGQLLDGIGKPANVRAGLAERLRRGEHIPGFGHQLYPNGDPRGGALLDMIYAAYPKSPAVQLAQAIEEEMGATLGLRPTIDFGLVTLTRTARLPQDSPLTLFAIGRTTGWIAHIIEQYRVDMIIRPRATYTGVQPGSLGS